MHPPNLEESDVLTKSATDTRKLRVAVVGIGWWASRNLARRDSWHSKRAKATPSTWRRLRGVRDGLGMFR